MVKKHKKDRALGMRPNAAGVRAIQPHVNPWDHDSLGRCRRGLMCDGRLVRLHCGGGRHVVFVRYIIILVFFTVDFL